MKINNPELELLASISKTLTECVDPLEILNLIARIFTKYGRASGKFSEMDKANIYIFDENSRTLRDFSKSWIVMEETHDNSHNDKLYFALGQFSHFSFFLNDRAFKLEEITNFSILKGFNENNVILFPLKRKNKPFGILELCFPQAISRLMAPEFFMLLSVVTYQISLKIQNTILTEQMRKNINFHESMKNIAKIIETQYEFNYIIPIIGEMIDRFITDHLIYIFLRDEEENEFKLVWPNACRDKNILDLLPKVTAKSRFILTEGEKVALFPLVGEKSLLGCVVAHSNIDKLSKKEIEYLEQLTTQSSITLQRANVYAEVLKHATLDALTGLNNRRQFESRLKQEVATAKRQNKPLCAMMMDVDFFKKFNDTYGHVVGDCVLKAVANTIKNVVRESDIASRYGGEEFTVLLPFTKVEEAAMVADRLRQAVQDTEVEYVNDKGEVEVKVHVTISIGVYQYRDVDSPKELYENADKGLYAAKEAGRNRVVIHREGDEAGDEVYKAEA